MSSLKIMAGTMLLFGILVNIYLSVVTSSFISTPIQQKCDTLEDLIIRDGYKVFSQNEANGFFLFAIFLFQKRWGLRIILLYLKNILFMET